MSLLEQLLCCVGGLNLFELTHLLILVAYTPLSNSPPPVFLSPTILFSSLVLSGSPILLSLGCRWRSCSGLETTATRNIPGCDSARLRDKSLTPLLNLNPLSLGFREQRKTLQEELVDFPILTPPLVPLYSTSQMGSLPSLTKVKK